QCGPIRHTMSDPWPVAKRVKVHESRFTTGEPGGDGTSIQEIYNELAVDEPRNNLIAAEVCAAAAKGRNVRVLTNRLAQLQELLDRISESVDVPVLALHGRLNPAERRARRSELAALNTSGDQFVLVAMDKVAGEGFDLPALNTLFLAMPVSFKGRVIQ